MKNLSSKKLIRILKLLTKEELKDLSKFLRSPYFNKSEVLISLFETLEKFHPEFDQPRFHAKGIYKKVFPKDKSYTERKLQKRMSELVNQLTTFLKVQELEKNEFLSQSLLSKSFLKRTDFELFFKTANDYQKKIETSPIRDPNYHYEHSVIFRDLYLQSLQVRLGGERDHVLQSNHHLDRFYFLTKLEFICAILSRNYLMEESNTFPFLKETITFVKEHFDEDPIFKIYLDLIDLYQLDSNDTLFSIVFDAFKKHAQIFAPKQKMNLLYQLINYTNKRLKANQNAFSSKQSELYKFGLEKDVFLQRGFLPEQTFLNIGVSFAIAKDFDFIDHLLDQYLEKVPSTEQESVKKLILAFKYFHQGEYHAAFDLINNFNETAIFYLLRIRLLRLRCLYEIQVEEGNHETLLFSQIQSFESYFKRTYDVKNGIISDYLNFSEALRAIIHRDPLKPISLTVNNLTEKVEKYKSVVARKWLLEKIAHLKLNAN